MLLLVVSLVLELSGVLLIADSVLDCFHCTSVLRYSNLDLCEGPKEAPVHCSRGLQIAFGFTQTILVFRVERVHCLASTAKITSTQAGSAAVCDITITPMLWWLLHSSKSNIKSTNNVLTKLTIYTVNRGAATSVAALMNLILVDPPYRRERRDANPRSAVSPSVTVEKVAHLKEAVPGWFERPIPCDRCRKQGVSCPQNPERGPCLRCQAQRKGCVTQSDTGAVVGVASSRSRRRVAPSGAVEVSGEGAGAGESGPASWFPIVKGEHIRGASLRAASARAEGGVVGSEFLHGEHVPVGVRDALAEANEMLGRDQLAQRSLVDEVDVVGLQTLRASRHAVLRVLVQEAHLAAARVEIARDTLSQVRQRLADTVAALNEVDDRLEQLDAEAGDVVTDDGEAWGGIVDDGMED
ncbi:hypothetical protein D9615_010527 [Tricholomella constricta]|uniref:DUF6534 domain-containing protein n=1 Tax=Tricholomella constricta TaxID=117010 RepID=A0A8H5GN85_9AGAR|nr:hypothetical protein D9615_010527 [Tricholomella constricta]